VIIKQVLDTKKASERPGYAVFILITIMC